MSFYQDIFVPLCAVHGTNPTAAAREMGYSNGTASNWNKRGTMPSRTTLQRIADYFGMTVNEMLSGKTEPTPEKEKPDEPKPAGPSAAQAALIEYCRHLSEPESAAALATLIALQRSLPQSGAQG